MVGLCSTVDSTNHRLKCCESPDLNLHLAQTDFFSVSFLKQSPATICVVFTLHSMVSDVDIPVGV